MWKELKSQVCNGDLYKTANWFTELADHMKTLTEDLRKIQIELGIDKSIEPQ